jgi:hypothetical protein
VSALLLNGTPGRSGLRSRGTTPNRDTQVPSHRSLCVEEDWSRLVESPRWPVLRGEASRIQFALDTGIVVVTWGSTPVDRSITIMDWALRRSRRHRSRCQPALAGRDDASWFTSVRQPLTSFGSEETTAALLRKDGDGIASALVKASVSLLSRALVYPRVPRPPPWWQRVRAPEATEPLAALVRGCSGSRDS